MSKQKYDVIIIGGGPAGLFAGIICARNELKTLVLEKKIFPIDKACGEGIMPSGLANFKKLGIIPFLEKYPYHCFKGVRYVSGNGKIAEASFSEGYGWGVQRTKLSSALHECAKTLAHLEIQEGVSAEYSLGENPVVCLNDKVFSPNLLIGADGLHSKVRKLANLEAIFPKLKRWGIRQHFKIEPWSAYVEIHWGPGIEAYVTPVSENSVNISILWDARRFKPDQGGKRLFDSMLSEFPNLQERIKKSDVLDDSVAAGPLYQKALSAANGKILLIGDASGFFDPITGEGINLAAMQALLLEKYVVLPLKEKTVNLEKALTDYSRACTHIYRPYRIFTSLVLLLRLWPSVTNKVIQFLQAFPTIFQKLLSVNMR